VIYLTLQLHHEIYEVRVHRRPDVAGERPRRRGPHQQVLARPVLQREPHEHCLVLDEPITLLHLLLGEADAAPPAPRHHVVTTIDEIPLVTLLEEAPDRVAILLAHR